MKMLGLCKVRRTVPVPAMAANPRPVDIQTLTAVMQNRMHVLREYTRKVTLPVFRKERRRNRDNDLLQRARKLVVSRPIVLDAAARARLAAAAAEDETFYCTFLVLLYKALGSLSRTLSWWA